MLKQLIIRSVALVDELELAFQDGLNVMTGETGAGKSIIVDAVGFLLGGRADRDMIRAGSAKAYVEGIFDVQENQSALVFLADAQMEAEDGLVTLSRELSQSGRSVCRINGIAVNVSMLKDISSRLLDIHGQHEHQSLLDERNHLRFLDDFGDDEHQRLLRQVREAYEAFASARRGYQQAQRQQAQRQERQQLLEIRRKDITDVKPEAGEEDNLKRRLDQLRNADRISRALQNAYGAVYDAPHDDAVALALLRNAKTAMADISALDDAYEALRARIESMFYEVEDIGLELRAAMEALEADEGALQQAAERLDKLKRLSRKYGMPADELPAELHRIQEELSQLESLDDVLIRLQSDLDKSTVAYEAAAKQLSASRRRLAAALSERMEQELGELNMAGTAFVVQVEAIKGEASSEGMDQITMLLAPNRGEEAKPLTKIASGGEVSRLMLALKSIAAEHNVIPTMIFDEIDTGISGRTAQVVAQKLWSIARYSQVLCVTHLQQIAAMASTHFLVEKGEQAGRTITAVRQLAQDDRVKEVSRIISGYSKDSATSLTHAQHMLQEAADYRQATT